MTCAKVAGMADLVKVEGAQKAADPLKVESVRKVADHRKETGPEAKTKTTNLPSKEKRRPGFYQDAFSYEITPTSNQNQSSCVRLFAPPPQWG